MRCATNATRPPVERLLPDPVVGTLLGCVLGFFAGISLAFTGIETPPLISVVFAVLGGVVGCVLGIIRQQPPGRARSIGGWCFTLMCIVGGIGFLIGFVGPIIYSPDSPQGPLLGIFLTALCANDLSIPLL